MLDERFLLAWFCRPSRFLGRTVFPFSLGHFVVLEALKSPLLDPDAKVMPEDLVLAVAVCSRRDAFSPLPKPTLRDKWESWRLRRNSNKFVKQASAFFSWMAECRTGPDIMADDDLPKTNCIAPWPLEVAAVLLKHGKFSEVEIWEMPVGRAEWYYVMLSRVMGAEVSIISDALRAELDDKLAFVGKTKAEMEASQ